MTEVVTGNVSEEVAPPFGASTVDPFRPGVKRGGPQIVEMDLGVSDMGGVHGKSPAMISTKISQFVG